jgi:virginiamycin B lyase
MSKLKFSATIGTVLALLIIVSSVFLIPKLISLSSPRQPSTPIHHFHPSAEVTEPDHSAQSKVAVQSNTTTNPWGIAIDSQRGFVWVAEPGCDISPVCPSVFPGFIGQYAQADGSFIQDFREPEDYSGPMFLAVDAKGDVWFTEPMSNALGEFDPWTDIWEQWTLPKDSRPYDLLLDKQGNIWFTEFVSNQIGFFNTKTHQLVENPIPTYNSNPYGITMDPQGTIWFTENRAGVDQIGSFTPTTTGKVQIIEHAVLATQPHLITSDKFGNIWFSEAFAGSIGEYNPATGGSRNFPVSIGLCPNPTNCPGTHISGISVDTRGDIWFTDSLSARVGYVIPSTGKVIATTLSRIDAHPHDGLIVDNYGTIWFTEQNAFLLVMWPIKTVK